jgi:thiopurine S-methyltransferase
MQHEFWHERWQRGEIGFHARNIHWALRGHWDSLTPETGQPVLVPLCGKSLDLRWLAEQGHPVAGVELSGQAAADFFAEWQRPVEPQTVGAFQRWQSGPVTIWQGDFLAFAPAKPFELFYDRAALVALPPGMRQRYLDHLVGLLAPQARGLLVTFEYQQSRMDGPPFAVLAEELQARTDLQFEQLERRDVLSRSPGFAARGLKALHEVAYRVSPRLTG